MAKVTTKYVCQQCGYETASWMGKCPNCQAWGSLVETIVSSKIEEKGRYGEEAGAKPMRLSQIPAENLKRITTGISEFDRVLGGPSRLRLNSAECPGSGQAGIVPGSVTLLAGDPGIGKSTLLLQMVDKTGGFYISGEESVGQLKLRAQRVGVKNENLCFLAETNVENILLALSQAKDIRVAVIDSIQTLYTEDLTGTPGSVGQVRECARKLLHFAKKDKIPMFLVGHVTKEGAIAGPMVLEHLVDTVLFMEGERYQTLRILRSFKNRFGPTDEVGLFRMEEGGMKEVMDPQDLFTSSTKNTPGSVAVVAMEGTRPILVEVQSLVVPTKLPYPRRIGRGIDYNRLLVLVAVIEKTLRLPLGGFDVYVNVVGGIKISEPAADLGIALSLTSSFKNKPLPPKTAAIGELGLLGEIRKVANLEKRIKEAKRLGFTNILSPENFSSLPQVVAKV